MSSSFGQVFRISTWGESHGTGVGVVIDGCPSLVPVTEEDIQRELDRRRPGQSDIVTPRREEDRAEILSGVLDGKTLGTPIAISVRNKDHRSSAYDEMARTYRPSHAASFCCCSPSFRSPARRISVACCAICIWLISSFGLS